MQQAKQFNVDRNNSDTFYRYRMPALVHKIEGKGNGIKTVVVNCADVAKALNRPSAYVAKHFGFEMGAQVNMDHEKDRYIVNGAHDVKVLQEKLDIFIKNWVLCVNCSNPETRLKVIGGKTIHSYCKACGQNHELKIPGRMAQYITKNVPEKFKTAEIYDDPTKIEAPLQTSPKQPQFEGWGDDADFKLSTDDNALIDRYLEDITGQMGQLTVGAEMVEKLDAEKKVEFFIRHVKKIKKKAGDFAAESGVEVGQLAKKLDVGELGVWAYCDVFQKWTKAEKMSVDKLLKYFTNFKTHLEELCKENEKSQRMLLGVVETVIYAHKKKLLPHTAHIVKQLYDDDILEEDAILKWAEKPTKKFVKKSFVEKMLEDANMAKFIEWLKQNDSSSDDEGSSDEETSDEDEPEQNEETGSSEKPSTESKQEESTPEEAPIAKNNACVELDDDDEDDIDIGDI